MTQPPDDAALVATDTVAFVQEWLMNADYDPSQFDRDFAAAIDARSATALEAKDRRIAELEAVLADCVDDMSHCGGDGFNHEGGEPIIAARAALEPSDKGVGR